MPPRAVLIVVAPERFRDEELIAPRRALEAAGHLVTVTSTRPGDAAGMLGAKIPIPNSITQLDPQGFDAMYVAGGSGAPSHLWDHEPLRVFVRAMHGAGKSVGAICLAPPVLARAGLLAGKRATTFPDPRAILELKRGGATYVQQSVVGDGTIVTADGPGSAEDFGAQFTQLVSL